MATASDSIDATRTRARSLRNTLYKVHAWAGFHLTLLTFVVLATGTLAVIADEIDWALDPGRRIHPVPGASPNWDAMYATASAVRPGERIVGIRLGEFDSMAARVRTVKANGRPHLVFVHPATGELTGDRPWLSVQRILRDLHRYLFILIEGLGLPLVTVAAVVLLVQMSSGLVITRKWGKAMTTLRVHRGVRVFIGDLHRASAMWTLWFTLLIVLTSAWYFAEWTMMKAGHSPASPRQSVAIPEEARDSLPHAPSRYVAAALAAYPELRPTWLLFPTGERGAVSVMGRSSDVFIRDRASRVALDPVTADVLRVHQPRDLTALQYVTDLADPLHFGDVGGLWTKWVWFACGLVLTVLSATGTWLTWRRTRTLSSAWHALTGGVLLLGGVFGFLYVRHFVAA